MNRRCCFVIIAFVEMTYQNVFSYIGICMRLIMLTYLVLI